MAADLREHQFASVEGFSVLDASATPCGNIFQDKLGHLDPLDRQLIIFCTSSSLLAVRWLVHLGASWDARDGNGSTCLHIACRTGSLSVVREVLAHVPNINATDIAHWTPLHIAAHMGRREVVVGLLQAKADPTCLNGLGHSPADYSMDHATREVIMGYDIGTPRMAVREMTPRPGGGAPAEDAIGLPQECEPELFFTSPLPAFADTRLYRKVLWPVAVEIFNLAPSKGLAFAVATGIAESYTSAMRTFMKSDCASAQQLGDLLGEAFSLSNLLRFSVLEASPLLHTGLVSALAVIFKTIRAPQDLVKLDRLVRGIALVWWRKHRRDLSTDEDGAGEEAAYERRADSSELVGLELMSYLGSAEVLGQLMLSALLLHTALQKGQEAVPFERWAQLNRGAEEGGRDIAEPVQRRIYDTLTKRAIALPIVTLPAESPPNKDFLDFTNSEANRWARLSSFIQAEGPMTLLSSLPFAEEGGLSNAEVLDTGNIEVIVPLNKLASSNQFWARLCSFILLLSRTASEVPLAMVDLRPLRVRHSDRTQHRFALGRGNDGQAPTADRGLPVQIIHLLPDGQWKEIKLPLLEIQVGTSEDLSAWLSQLDRTNL